MNGTKKDDCSCYAKSGIQSACPPARNVTHPLRYYEFTQEEIKALEECDKESFYRRCVPFSTLFGTLTYAAIKFECLNRNPYFGAVPKVMLAMLFGHAYGRISYMGECDAKLRELPANSNLGDVMRRYHEERYPPPPENNKSHPK